MAVSNSVLSNKTIIKWEICKSHRKDTVKYLEVFLALKISDICHQKYYIDVTVKYMTTQALWLGCFIWWVHETFDHSTKELLFKQRSDDVLSVLSETRVF